MKTTTKIMTGRGLIKGTSFELDIDGLIIIKRKGSRDMSITHIESGLAVTRAVKGAKVDEIREMAMEAQKKAPIDWTQPREDRDYDLGQVWRDAFTAEVGAMAEVERLGRLMMGVEISEAECGCCGYSQTVEPDADYPCPECKEGWLASELVKKRLI